MIGLRLRSEDLAKFGQLLLQQGLWNSKQLIPKEWVREATTFKIETPAPANNQPKELSDWSQGYCYQMWRGRNNTFRLDGMAGQFVILIPEKDAVVVLTANARNTQEEINLVHNYLIPAIKSDKPLPASSGLFSELQKRQKALSIKLPASNLSQPEMEAKISGREFMLSDNNNNIQSVYFAFSNGACTFAVKRDNKISEIKAGTGNWMISNSAFSSLLGPPRNPSSKSIDANYSVPGASFKTGACYSWTDKGTIEITGRFVEESLGSETIVCRISETDDAIRITLEPKAPAFATGRPAGPQSQVQLRGVMVNIK